MRATVAAVILVVAGCGIVLTAPEAEASHRPFIYPHGGYVTTAYHTWRSSCQCYHDALDISDDRVGGDAIVAAAAGKVTCRCNNVGGYGYYVMIDHGQGWVTLYAHLSGFNVNWNQQVAQGQTIGYEGSTGHSTGPHLHFEIRKNNVKQPIPGSYYSWVTRGAAIPRHYDWNPPNTDTTDPKTTAKLTGTSGSNGWFRSSVSVKLTATDASGISTTKYRIDGGAWRTYTGAFTVSGQGSHSVKYYSVDKKGNQESTRTSSLKIDTGDPVTSSTLSGTAGANGWWRSAVTVGLSASDATSGVSFTDAKRDGSSFRYGGPFTVTGDGAHTVQYRSRDVAGNYESWRSRGFSIDATAPSSSIAIVGPTYFENGWFVGASTGFTVSAADATSGVAARDWAWRGATHAYNGAFTLPGPDGASTVQFRARDVAGNTQAWQSLAVTLDATPPDLTVDGPPDGSLVTSISPTRVTAHATDALSGVARVEFRVDGAVRHVATQTPFVWDWATQDEALGEHTLSVRAVDRLENARTESATVTTVPASAAGGEATAMATAAAGTAAVNAAVAPVLAQLDDASALAAAFVEEGPSALPTIALVLDADSSTTWYRVGVTVDGAFVGLEGHVLP